MRACARMHSHSTLDARVQRRTENDMANSGSPRRLMLGEGSHISTVSVAP
eukprot:SAG11_NODE_18294_length_495_cov_0.719697_1_plen_49_part_01